MGILGSRMPIMSRGLALLVFLALMGAGLGVSLVSSDGSSETGAMLTTRESRELRDSTDQPELSHKSHTSEHLGEEVGGRRRRHSARRRRHSTRRRRHSATSPPGYPDPVCRPHAGLTFREGDDWFKAYRSWSLPKHLTNITYKNQTVDCNPSMCDNPPVCRIPKCMAIKHGGPDCRGECRADHDKGIKVASCNATSGCGIQ